MKNNIQRALHRFGRYAVRDYIVQAAQDNSQTELLELLTELVRPKTLQKLEDGVMRGKPAMLEVLACASGLSFPAVLDLPISPS